MFSVGCFHSCWDSYVSFLLCIEDASGLEYIILSLSCTEIPI